MKARRFWLPALLALATALPWTAISAPAARAATPPESDIPGIPLPSSVVSGLLGGPVYDVVYRIDVPAGYVLIAGLSGTPGTDFDLYLFDASATTVVNNVGVLTKSTGPTSSEHIAWPTPIGGTYYLDLNGASNVEGTYTLSVQVVPDPTPPAASLHLANGVAEVNSTTVQLLLAGFDDLSGVTQMILSNDGATWSAPAPIQTQVAWEIPPGDGPKTVWARVMNGVGLWSQPASVSLTLDTTSPTVLSVSPPAGTVVTTPRPTISVVFSKPVADASWASLGLIVQAPNGGILPGTYLYYPTTRTGTFTPSADLLPGYLYIISIGAVQDLAGNRVATTPSWTLSYVPQSAVTAAVVPRVSVTGTRVTLSGTASVPTGAQLQLEAKEGSAADYAPIGSIAPSGGRYALALIPAMNTRYRVSYAGSAVASAASAEAVALVRRTVALAGLSASGAHAAKVGRAVTLRAQVGPAGAVSVSYRLYRYDAARRRWVYAGSFGRTTSPSGQASLTWTPKAAGSWYWRVVVGSTTAFANNISPVYRYAVSR